MKLPVLIALCCVLYALPALAQDPVQPAPAPQSHGSYFLDQIAEGIQVDGIIRYDWLSAWDEPETKAPGIDKEWVLGVHAQLPVASRLAVTGSWEYGTDSGFSRLGLGLSLGLYRH